MSNDIVPEVDKNAIVPEAPLSEPGVANPIPATQAPTIPEQVPAWATGLVDQLKQQAATIKMLTDMQGPNKIKSFEESQKDHTQKFATLKIIDGQPVIGWSSLDYSEYRPKAPDALSENVFVTLQLLDGTKKRVNYVELIRAKELLSVRLAERGNTAATIEFSDEAVLKYGLTKNTLLISNAFLNA